MAEAKQRRCNDTGNLPQQELAEMTEDVERSKEPRSLRSSWLFSFVGRRKYDLVGVNYFWGCCVVSDYLVRWVLLREEHFYSPALYMVMVALHLFLLGGFILFWIRAVYVGAGVVPPERSSTVLPEDLADALMCGKTLATRPFGPEDSWCGDCNRWKPPIAHHCQTCRQCALWMDHHCNFLGVCIGFYNYRLFLCWVYYGLALQALWTIISVNYWLQMPESDSWWTLVLRFIWAMYLFRNASSMRNYGAKSLRRTQVGWVTQVFEAKFDAVYERAVELQGGIKTVGNCEQGFGAEMQSLTDAGETSQQVLEELLKALEEVTQLGRRGLFYFGSRRLALEFWFGEPLSWKWLLPARGGSGDPLRPTHFDPLACSKWAKLRAPMEKCITLIQMNAAKQKKWQERLSGVIGSLGTQGP